MPKKVQLVGDKNTAGEPIISTDQTSVYYNNKLIAVEGSKVATGYLGSIGYTGSIGSILTTHGDRKSTRLNSSHIPLSRMPSSA